MIYAFRAFPRRRYVSSKTYYPCNSRMFHRGAALSPPLLMVAVDGVAREVDDVEGDGVAREAYAVEFDGVGASAETGRHCRGKPRASDKRSNNDCSSR